jgi:hypothetical protein
MTVTAGAGTNAVRVLSDVEDVIDRYSAGMYSHARAISTPLVLICGCGN